MLRKILVFVITAVFLSACAGTSKPATDITVEMTDFSYNPSSITIPAGQPVTLTLKNTGFVEHDFVIKEINVGMTAIESNGSEGHAHGTGAEYDLHVSTMPGDTSVLQFNVLEPGTYEFFCSVEGHKEAGMIGELIVLAQE